jgi:hypothetical protein
MVRAMLILIMDVMTDFIFYSFFFHSASCTLYVVSVERREGRKIFLERYIRKKCLAQGSFEAEGVGVGFGSSIIMPRATDNKNA